MKQCILQILLMISFVIIPQSYAANPCESARTPQEMGNCYIVQYQEAESRMEKFLFNVGKMLGEQNGRQLQRAMAAWRNYMNETCELESRLYGNEMRPVTIPMCQNRMIGSYLQYLANLMKKYEAVIRAQQVPKQER